MSAAQQILAGLGGSVATDPDFASVVALLHGEGTNGSTTITDQIGKTWTVGDNAAISTAQYKYGTASIGFDGTNDRVECASHADFGYGTSDFTIEYFIRAAVSGSTIHYDQRTVGGEVVPTIYNDGTGVVYFYADGAARITSSAGVMVGATWHHVAVSRVSGETKLFVDGTQRGSTYTDSNNYAQSHVLIGNVYDFTAGINGYMDEIRITKGVGRYTGTFTPPTAAFPDA